MEDVKCINCKYVYEVRDDNNFQGLICINDKTEYWDMEESFYCEFFEAEEDCKRIKSKQGGNMKETDG